MEHKALVVLSPKVSSTIKWFTHNFDTEIGAIGTVSTRTKNGKKYFYVEKLHFPKQEVSAATVKFGEEMWGDLIKDLSIEELGKIGFYWHRHPSGNATHSSTDEEDTYETFMSEQSKPQPKFFIFMQTASKDGKIDREARIDIRYPIRTTILNESIQVAYEYTDEEKAWMKEKEAYDEKLKKQCEEIAERAVVKPKPYVYVPYTSTNYDYNRHFDTSKNTTEIVDLSDKWDGTFTNNNLPQIPLANEEIAQIECKEGAGKLSGGSLFIEMVEDELQKNGILYNSVSSWKKEKIGDLTFINVQPKPKSYKGMKQAINDVFIKFCDFLTSAWEEESNLTNNQLSDITKLFDYNKTEKYEILKSPSGEMLSIRNNPGLVKDVLEDMEQVIDIDWENYGQSGIVYDFSSNKNIGYISADKFHDTVNFQGHMLIDAVLESLEFLKEIKYIKEEEIKNEQSKSFQTK